MQCTAGAINVGDVAPGAIQWGVRWDDVLTFELRWSRELHYPDRLIVHRKGTPGWQVGCCWAAETHAM